MTRYLLDTDALIDFSKGVEPVTARILFWIDGAETVALCAVSVAEFYAGLPPEHAREWQHFISSLAYWEITPEVAMQAGQDRYHLGRVGVTMTITDALLAATARGYQATLVTSNVKDFPLEELSVLSIREVKDKEQ